MFVNARPQITAPSPPCPKNALAFFSRLEECFYILLSAQRLLWHSSLGSKIAFAFFSRLEDCFCNLIINFSVPAAREKFTAKISP